MTIQESDFVKELKKTMQILRLNNNCETLGEMADKIGISHAMLSAIERGYRKPSKRIMDSLKEQYNLGEEDLEKIHLAMIKDKGSVTLTIPIFDVADETVKTLAELEKTLPELDSDKVEFLVSQIKRILNRL